MTHNNSPYLRQQALLEAIIATGAMKKPVFVGDLVKEANAALRRLGVAGAMEASWQRYLRRGHRYSVADLLAKHGLCVLCGRDGVITSAGEYVPVERGWVAVCRNDRKLRFIKRKGGIYLEGKGVKVNLTQNRKGRGLPRPFAS